MQNTNTAYRERTVAALLLDRAQTDLLAYASESEAARIQEHCDAWAALAEDERSDVVAQHLANAASSDEVVMLGEIHPQWIADVVARETPRVIGVLLRFLPSQHARDVIAKLPAPVRTRLPNVIESFSVPDAVLRIVRQRFESHFLPVRPLSSVDTLDFSELAALSIHDVRTVLHDIGIDELAFAFQRLSKPALRVLLNRLKFGDAQALSQRMASLDDADVALQRDAQNAILGMALEHVNPDVLIDEIAIVALAKAVQASDLPMIRLLKQKLPPHLAYVLQREADIHVRSNHPEIIRVRQQRVMERVGELVHAGRIDRLWWDRLAEDVRNAVLGSEADELMDDDGVEDAVEHDEGAAV